MSKKSKSTGCSLINCIASIALLHLVLSSKNGGVDQSMSISVAGDAALIREFRRYRTYHGCAMPVPTQLASISAWQDEQHVRENRDKYREKFQIFCCLFLRNLY